MPIELLSTNPVVCEGVYPIFEFLTLEPDMVKEPELWNANPKMLDEGVVCFICEKGEGELVIDMNTFHIRRGSFCLLLPYTVIQIINFSDDLTITAIAAGIEFLEKLSMLQPVEDYATLIQENPCLQLSDDQLKEVDVIYTFITNRLADKNRPLASEIKDTLLTYLALEAVSVYDKLKPTEKRKLSRPEQIFRNFTFILAKHFRQQREVGFYAEQACLTPRHFSEVIKRKSGKSPSQWIAERTILLIKFLLENSEMSIQEVSNELNFPNQSFFTRYFKKHTGVTPKAFRMGIKP